MPSMICILVKEVTLRMYKNIKLLKVSVFCFFSIAAEIQVLLKVLLVSKNDHQYTWKNVCFIL